MSWLIDGSNVLGRLRLPRESDAAKRELVTLLSRFARARRVKVACYFDGPEPASFGKNLGSVSVVFSGQRSADDLIVARVASGTSWTVVTSDQALAARVAGRRVTIVAPGAFAQELERLPSEGEGALPRTTGRRGSRTRKTATVFDVGTPTIIPSSETTTI